MTAYATFDEFCRLGLRHAAVADYDAAVAQILSTSRFVDTYLVRRHTVPLEQWPESLSEAVCRIAAWRYIAQRGTVVSGPDEITKMAHDESLKWIQDLAARKATLVGFEDKAPLPGAANVPEVDSEELRGW